MKTEQYINVVKACLDHSIEIDMLSNGHITLDLTKYSRYGFSHVFLTVKHKRIASSVITQLGHLGTFTFLEGKSGVMYAGYEKPYHRIAKIRFSIP